jgi:hypothetical protein
MAEPNISFARPSSNYKFTLGALHVLNRCLKNVLNFTGGSSLNPQDEEDGQALYRAYLAGKLTLSRCVVEYGKLTLMGKKPCAIFTAVDKILAISEPAVLFLDVPMKEEGATVPTPLEFEMTVDDDGTIVRSSQHITIDLTCERVPKVKSYRFLELAARIAASVIKMDDGSPMKVFVNANVGELKWDSVMTEADRVYQRLCIACMDFMTVIKQYAYWTKMTSSGRDLADHLCVFFQTQGLKFRTMFISVVYASMPESIDNMPGYITRQQIVKDYVTSDEKDDITLNLPQEVVYPDLKLAALPKFRFSWQYVLEQTRVFRGSKDSGMSSLSNDYFFGLFLSRDKIQSGSLTADLLATIGERNVCLRPNQNSLSLTFEMALNLAYALKYFKRPNKVTYVQRSFMTNCTLPENLTILNTFDPEFDGIVYEGTHIKAVRSNEVSHQKKGRANAFRMAFEKAEVELEHQVKLWRKECGDTFKVCYVDAHYAADNKDWYVATMMHEGYVMIFSHEYDASRKVVALSVDSNDYVEPVYDTLDSSIQLANMTRLYYPLYGMTYQRLLCQSSLPGYFRSPVVCSMAVRTGLQIMEDNLKSVLAMTRSGAIGEEFGTFQTYADSGVGVVEQTRRNRVGAQVASSATSAPPTVSNTSLGTAIVNALSATVQQVLPPLTTTLPIQPIVVQSPPKPVQLPSRQPQARIMPKKEEESLDWDGEEEAENKLEEERAARAQKRNDNTE